MTDYLWPDDLVPYNVTFYLQPHVTRSESPFDRQQKIYGLSAPRWVCRLSFRGGYDATGAAQAAYGARLDAMIAKLKGGANRVQLWDFRRPGRTSFTNAAIAIGDTSVTLTGAGSSGLYEGEYIGGDGRPHIVTDVTVRGNNQILTVDPPFRARVAAGDAIFEEVSGYFRLTSDDAGSNSTVVGGLVVYDLEFTEDLGGLDGAAKDYLPALTTVGAAIHAVYGNLRLVQGYAGPAFRAIRNSDSAAVDVSFADDQLYTGNTISLADIVALKGTGSVVRVDKWYDQSGNGRDMTQTTAAKRPGVRDDAYQNGVPEILIDGGAYIEGPTRGFDFTHALTGRGCTYFLVTDFHASAEKQILLNYAGSAGHGRLLYQNYAANPGNSCILEFSGAQYTAWPGKHFRAAPVVYAIREKNAPLDLFIDGVATAGVWQGDLSSAVIPSAETLTAGNLGYSGDPALVSFGANMRVLAAVMVQGTLNDADVAAITSVLQSNFGIPTSFDSRLVVIGDSIAEGVECTNTLELMWYLRDQDLDGSPLLFDFGISGKKLSDCYNDRALFDATVYASDVPVVYFIEAGINDIRIAGTSAAALYTTLTTYIAYLKGLGPNVRVVANTILKSGLNTTTQQNTVVAYNNLVKANTAGADVINDVEALLAAVDPSYWTNTLILADQLHPSSYGYTLLAPQYAEKFNEAVVL